MTRYFFDLADGSREPDLTGTELLNDHAAEREAIRFLGEVLKHEPHRLSAGTLRVEMRQENADVALIVSVAAQRCRREASSARCSR